MPATWAPDRVIASICQAADPLSPSDWYGLQLAPVADAQIVETGSVEVAVLLRQALQLLGRS